jgi:hypothetical protein
MPRLTDLVMATIYDSIDSAAEQAGYLTFVPTQKISRHAKWHVPSTLTPLGGRADRR